MQLLLVLAGTPGILANKRSPQRPANRLRVLYIALTAAIVVSRLTAEPDESRTVRLADIAFATTSLFNTLAMLVVAILAGLYVWLW